MSGREAGYEGLRAAALDAARGARLLVRGLLVPADLAIFVGRLAADPRLETALRERLVAAALVLTPPGVPLALVLLGRGAVREAIFTLNEAFERHPEATGDAWPGEPGDLDRLRSLVSGLASWAREGLGAGLVRRLRRHTAGIRAFLQDRGVAPRGL